MDKKKEKKKKVARINDPKDNDSSFRRDDGMRVEEQFELHHLEQLKYYFQHHQPSSHELAPVSAYSPAKREARQPGLLTPSEFRDMLVKVLGTHDYDDQMDTLFTKLDTSCDGYVDWNEFCTYILLQLRENDYMRGNKKTPFRSEAKIRHIVHNRQETTSKILAVENPIKYITLSKEGAICVWDPHLHLERQYSLGDNGPPSGLADPRSQKRRVREWVTDAVYMPNAHKLAIATTGRDLRFYDATSTQYYEEFHLYGLPNVPCCLVYHYQPKNPAVESQLIYGDDKGDVCIFDFLRPISQLFEAPFQKQEGVQKVFFQDLQQHHKYVRHCRFDEVHPEPVRKMIYMQENHSIISCSTCPYNSIVTFDLMRKKKTYIFKITKGCECFDYNRQLNILTSGSTDHIVRLWNPYVVKKPVALLTGHAMGIVDVKIHEQLNQIFSFSRDTVLKVWDVKEHCCLQTIFVKFPSSLLGRMPDYGPFTLHLQPPPCNSLLVTANDYIACLRLGKTGPPPSSQPTTHMQQLCCAIYNPFFKTVVTGADDSTIGIWDLETGAKSMLFTNAHGGEEITCMTFDPSWRRLFTGARNGTIKVIIQVTDPDLGHVIGRPTNQVPKIWIWNIQNGHNLHQLDATMEAEVTGIVPLTDRKLILAAGWSRMITQYSDSEPDNAAVKPNTLWKGGHIHQEDILSMAYCPPNILATASFDGHICVWSLETEMLFLQLRKARNKQPPSTQQSENKRKKSGNSRPNSRHRKSHKPAVGQRAPVDKLLFLQARAKVRYTETAILISSEAGVLHWWSIYGQKHELGQFYAPENTDESVLGLCTNPTDSVLVSGDTQGRISIWSIINYCTKPRSRQVRVRPDLEVSWMAHTSAVVSIDWVSHDNGDFLISASTDHTAKMWDLKGQCVGTFGQKVSWNLKSPSTWFDAPPEDIPVVAEPSTPSKHPTEDTVERTSQPETWQEVDIPVMERGDTLVETEEDRDTFEEKTTEGRSATRASNDVTTKLPDLPKKAVSVGPGGTRKRTTFSIATLTQRSQTFAYGSGHDFTNKAQIGFKAEADLVRRSEDRRERREHFADVDYSQSNRLGKICCPYQMLETPDLCTIDMPENLPVTTRMVNRGYTSDTLTTDVVRNMDFSYYAEPSQTPGSQGVVKGRRASSLRPAERKLRTGSLHGPRSADMSLSKTTGRRHTMLT